LRDQLVGCGLLEKVIKPKFVAQSTTLSLKTELIAFCCNLLKHAGFDLLSHLVNRGDFVSMVCTSLTLAVAGPKRTHGKHQYT